MLLYIYLGTTAYVWFDTFKSMYDMRKRIKKEGYVFTGNNYFGIGDIVIGTIFLVALSIPVFNLIFPLSNRDKEESYMWYKDKLLEDGAIELPFDEENVKSIKTKIISINNSKLAQRVNRDNHIYYSSLYKDEEETAEKGFTYKKEYFNKRH